MTTQIPEYAYAETQCDGIDYCTIESVEECDAAASFLLYTDTKAYTFSHSTRVPGCSINNAASLRFNSNLGSTGTNHYDPVNFPFRKVLCQRCPEIPYVAAAQQCDESQFCTINELSECEDAAAYLSLSRTTAKLIDNGQVRGCSTNIGGALRWNQNMDSSTMHGTEGNKAVLCSAAACAGPQFAYEKGSCDGEEYCTIHSHDTCEEAAVFLGHIDDTASTIFKTNYVAGCSSVYTGKLRFNSALDSTATMGVSLTDDGLKNVICERCSTRRTLNQVDNKLDKLKPQDLIEVVEITRAASRLRGASPK